MRCSINVNTFSTISIAAWMHPRFQALGLELSIAKTLIDGIGGKVVMESELGKGSVVIMRFHSAL